MCSLSLQTVRSSSPTSSVETNAFFNESYISAKDHSSWLGFAEAWIKPHADGNVNANPVVWRDEDVWSGSSEKPTSHAKLHDRRKKIAKHHDRKPQKESHPSPSLLEYGPMLERYVSSFETHELLALRMVGFEQISLREA